MAFALRLPSADPSAGGACPCFPEGQIRVFPRRGNKGEGGSPWGSPGQLRCLQAAV